MHFKMSSEICFILDQSKIMSLGIGLKVGIQIPMGHYIYERCVTMPAQTKTKPATPKQSHSSMQQLT